jgi:hypothetical protein
MAEQRQIDKETSQRPEPTSTGNPHAKRQLTTYRGRFYYLFGFVKPSSGPPASQRRPPASQPWKLPKSSVALGRGSARGLVGLGVCAGMGLISIFFVLCGRVGRSLRYVAPRSTPAVRGLHQLAFVGVGVVTGVGVVGGCVIGGGSRCCPFAPHASCSFAF